MRKGKNRGGVLIISCGLSNYDEWPTVEQRARQRKIHLYQGVCIGRLV